MNDLQFQPQLGILAIDGADAVTFLQGQATCDCRQLSAQRGALGALCNLQGRMLVSFYVTLHVARDGNGNADGLRLVMARDRVQAVLTHLKKYAVFSKVTLRDDSDAFAVLGTTADNSGNEPFTVSATAAVGGLLHLRGHRALVIDSRTAMTTDGSNHWRVAAIRAGELLVDTANADKFLPQALNYDVIDGVNFRKGCYTGQEVVARMHFKGKMKERLYVLQAAGIAAPAAGTTVIDGAGNKVGEVVDAGVEAGTCFLGAVVRHDAMQAGGLRLGSGDNAPLTPAVAPYQIPAAT